MICIGQNPPPRPDEPADLPGPLPADDVGRRRASQDVPTGDVDSPLCRFEVIVRDNDENLRPVAGRLLLDQAIDARRQSRLSSIR